MLFRNRAANETVLKRQTATCRMTGRQTNIATNKQHKTTDARHESPITSPLAIGN